MTTKRPTSVAEWKKKSSQQGAGGQPVDLPSGNTALVRIAGVDVFLKNNMVPNSLLGVLKEAMKTGKAPDMEKFADDNADNIDVIKDIINLADAVTVYSVLEPQVEAVPVWTEEDAAAGRCLPAKVGQENRSARDPEVLYVDEVDLEDKMFIFQLASGGTRDLESFRKGLEGDVGAVRPRKDVGKSAKRPGRTTPKKS